METKKTTKKSTKPKYTLIAKALKLWSPKGLCEGTLVLENGTKAKTQACAIGCLALEFAYSKEGTAFFKREDLNRKEYLKNALHGNTFVGGAFAEAMRDYYNIDSRVEGAIMGYNDACIDDNGKATHSEYKKLPATLRKTIYGLRQKFEKWVATQGDDKE